MLGSDFQGSRTEALFRFVEGSLSHGCDEDLRFRVQGFGFRAGIEGSRKPVLSSTSQKQQGLPTP